MGKILYIHPGGKSSLHYHKEKHETFLCLRGKCFLETNTIKKKLFPGDVSVIPPKTSHRFSSGSGCFIIEVSTYEVETPHSTVRLAFGDTQSGFVITDQAQETKKAVKILQRRLFSRNL